VEAAAVLQVAVCTVYALLRERRIAHVRVGRRYLITPEALDQYLAAATITPLTAPSAPSHATTVPATPGRTIIRR
jgi:excisionase family DNA binding protein